MLRHGKEAIWSITTTPSPNCFFLYGYNWDRKTDKYIQFEEKDIEDFTKYTFSEMLATLELDRNIELIIVIPVKVVPFGQSGFDLIFRDKSKTVKNENRDTYVLKEPNYSRPEQGIAVPSQEIED